MGLRDGDSIYSTMENKGDDFNKDFVCLFVFVVPGIRLRVPYIVDTRQAIYHSAIVLTYEGFFFPVKMFIRNEL